MQIIHRNKFNRDLRRMQRRGSDLRLLQDAVELLISGVEILLRYADHPLRGKWQGFRELHIAPDWLLIYLRTDYSLELVRTGSHSDLF